MPKLNKQSAFSGRPGTIDTWASHKDTYLSGAAPSDALLVATSYLQGEAFSWWQTYAETTQVNDWPSIREALKTRFRLLNKVHAARDLLHK